MQTKFETGIHSDQRYIESEIYTVNILILIIMKINLIYLYLC